MGHSTTPQRLRWIVTGCTNSPFGAALVLALRARGDPVVATACHSEDLQELKDAGATCLDLNVIHPQEVIDATVQKAVGILGGLDVLVNCPGYVETGLVEEVDHDRFISQFGANVFGPLNTVRSVLPLLRRQRSGTIVFLGTIGGEIGSGALTGAQSGLTGIVDSLRQELAPFSIRTLMVEMGWYNTKAFATTHVISKPGTLEAYEKLRPQLVSMESAMAGDKPGNPRKAAEGLIDVLMGEGTAKGKPWPARIPLGPGALERTRVEAEARLKVCADFEELISRSGKC